MLYFVEIALERFKDFISSIIYGVSNFSMRQSNVYQTVVSLIWSEMYVV